MSYISTIGKTGIAVALLVPAIASQAIGAGAPPPGPGETHVPYEYNVLDPETEVQGPGAVLAAPGDLHRYTYVIDDPYFADPDYKLERALLGVHILDADYSEAGDGAPEWGAILLDGEPGTVSLGDVGLVTDLVEIKSDPEIESGLPPYIFNVTASIKDDGILVLEVINLNEDGGTDMSAEYGDFNALRGGLHLYYSKVEG